MRSNILSERSYRIAAGPQKPWKRKTKKRKKKGVDNRLRR